MDASDSFLSAICEITGMDSYHSVGELPFFLPALVVDDVGEIAFLLPAAQAKELIAVAECVPYGREDRMVWI